MQDLATVSHVRECIRGPQILGTLGPAPLGWGVADPLARRRSPHMLSRQIWSL